MSKSTRPCKIDECTKTVHGHNLCVKHYKQVLKNGSVTQSIYDKRPAIIEDDVAKIPLGVNAKDGYAIVDKEYAYLDKYNWILSNRYAKSAAGKRGVAKGLHRYILGDKPGLVIDHINGNPLDNRIANLRHCKQAQNSYNSVKKSNNTTGYKGVTFNKHAGKFIAQIKRGRECYYLGLFTDVIEAAKVYDAAAVTLYKEYAKLNFGGNE